MIGSDLGVLGSEESIAIEDGIGACKEGEGLGFGVELESASGEADGGMGHKDSGGCDGFNPIEGIYGGLVLEFLSEGCTGDRDEEVNGNGLGLWVQLSESEEEFDAINLGFAHTDDTAGANFNSGLLDVFQSIESILIFSGGNNFFIIILRGIDIMVIIIEAGIGKE